MKEYKVTEKQLEELREIAETMLGAQHVGISRELAYLVEDIEAQPERVQWIEDVKEFRRCFGLPTPAKTTRELRTQYKCVREEFFELQEAFDAYRNDVPGASLKMLDAVCDLLYTTIGLGLGMGYDLEGAFAEVQRSNMTKLGADGKPIYRADGKVLKGPNFEPPRLEPFLPKVEVRDINA